MDATFTSVIRLWEQQCSLNEISNRLKVSHGKVRKILITAGYYKTPESILYAEGMPVDAIAAKLGKSIAAVNSNVPYSKGLYDAEYPTINALRIRRCRDNKHEADKEE